MRRYVLAALTGSALLGLSATAGAQEIQLTGPLAGAPAVRNLRLHREGRFEIAPSVSFTLLDEYLRTIMPGAKLSYHLTDWFGIGVWGGYGFQTTTGTTDQLQQKAVDNRSCAANPAAKACRLTAVDITRPGAGGTATGKLKDDQMGHMTWAVAPQVDFVPFRGKVALFSSIFMDTDVNIFLGPAFIGVKERADCGDTGQPDCSHSFSLKSRTAIAPTFGLGLNFYPAGFMGFGVEWRALPFSWNTSGFDNHGGGPDQDFPDNKVNDADREFHFNSMLTVQLSIQLPPSIKTSD